jgi:hypothetical protein
MLKYVIALSLLFTLFNTQSFSSDITHENLKKHILFLSSDALQGRLMGSQGEKLAIEYAARQFGQIGLKPAGDQGTFFQPFILTAIAKPEKDNSISMTNQHGYNVIARLTHGNGQAPFIIIGAHIDHLGEKLTHAHSTLIYHGADDNASGVASVLEMARKLSVLNAQKKLPGNKDILFILWSGEELGLFGSSYFIKHMKHNIFAYINLDMVGRLKKNLVLQGVGSSSRWPLFIKRVQKNHDIPLTLHEDPYLPTDSTSFYLHGVPAINFFTGAHNEYHTSRDIFSLLNIEGMERISNFLTDLIILLEAEQNTMDYQLVKKTHDKGRSGFKIYLGTIPDYASQKPTGVELSGVIKASPADQAGIRQGDVIIKLAGKKIRNIYDYSTVLNGLKAKKPTSLFILREQKKLALTIIPESRR